MAIDYEIVLKKAKDRGLLSGDRLADAEQDDDFLPDLIWEEGKDLLTLAWDGGSPGNCGAIGATEWNGFYFLVAEEEPQGPFDSFADVIALQEFHFPSPKPELTSSFLPHGAAPHRPGYCSR